MVYGGNGFMSVVLLLIEVVVIELPYSTLALAVARVFLWLGRGVKGSFRLWLSLSISIASDLLLGVLV